MILCTSLQYLFDLIAWSPWSPVICTGEKQLKNTMLNILTVCKQNSGSCKLVLI